MASIVWILVRVRLRLDAASSRVGAAAQSVFQLVGEIEQVVDGQFLGDRLTQLALNLVQGADVRRLDLGDFHHVPAQGALHGAAGNVGRQRKYGLHQFGEKLAKLVAAQHAQFHRLGVHARRVLGDLGEGPTVGQLAKGVLGGAFVGQDHLAHPSPLRPAEFVAALLVGLGQALVGHGDLARQVVGQQGEDAQGAVFGRREAVGVLLVEGDQLVLARFLNVGHLIVGDKERLGDAPFGAMAVERIEHRRRHRPAFLKALQQLAAPDVAAHHLDEGVFAQTVTAQRLIEDEAVEPAKVVAEGGVAFDLGAHQVVADEDAQVLGGEIEQGALDHLLEDAVDQTHGPRLLAVEAAAEERSQTLQFALELPVQLIGGDLDAAHRRHLDDADTPADHVADAPGAETENQETEQQLDQNRAGALADILKHG